MRFLPLMNTGTALALIEIPIFMQNRYPVYMWVVDVLIATGLLVMAAIGFAEGKD